MKNLIKNYLPGILNTLLFIGSLVGAAMVKKDSITGEYSWVLIRLAAFLWSIIMAVGIYSKWFNIRIAFRELISAITDEDRKIQYFEWAHSTFKRFSILPWTLIWVVLGQVVITFYIANICGCGF